MESEKINLQSPNYQGDFVKKGSNCVYLFQESANKTWSSTTLTVEVLEELLKIAKE